MTLQQYLRHARLYGTECIVPTAIQEGDLGAREMVALKTEVAKIAADHRRAKKPPTWSDDVAKVDARDVLALDSEGLTVSEIVVHTGLSERVVNSALAKRPEPLAVDRKMPSTDVSGWDRQIMGLSAGQSADEGYVIPRKQAESDARFPTEEATPTAEPSEPLSLRDRLALTQTPEAKAKASATRALKKAQVDADIVRLRRERKMVPGGIAKVLNVGEARVRKLLKAEGLWL